jgi:hypothetical protein
MVFECTRATIGPVLLVIDYFFEATLAGMVHDCSVV